MRPKKLNCFGQNINVKYEKGLKAQGVMGLYSHEKNTIYIDSQITGADFNQTLLHELFHAVFGRLHIKVEDALEEIIVDTLAVVVDENFKLTRK